MQVDPGGVGRGAEMAGRGDRITLMVGPLFHVLANRFCTHSYGP